MFPEALYAMVLVFIFHILYNFRETWGGRDADTGAQDITGQWRPPCLSGKRTGVTSLVGGEFTVMDTPWVVSPLKGYTLCRKVSSL